MFCDKGMDSPKLDDLCRDTPHIFRCRGLQGTAALRASNRCRVVIIVETSGSDSYDANTMQYAMRNELDTMMMVMVMVMRKCHAQYHTMAKDLHAHNILRLNQLRMFISHWC